MYSNLKECPYCAELVKVKAIKCRHCGQNLSSPQTNSRSWDDPIAIICAVVAVILYLTNPTQKDFNEAIVQRINESGVVDKSNPFQKLMVGIASYAIDSATTRTNYYIFSIFEIDSSLLRIIDSDTPRLKFVGIAGRVIPLFQANPSNNLSPNDSQEETASEMSSNMGVGSANENSEGPEMKPFQQNCRGVLEKDDEFGLMLKNYQSNNLWDSWCDAELGDMSNKVLKVCSIGDKCEIRGKVIGHGAFEWHQIDQVYKINHIPEDTRNDAPNKRNSKSLGNKEVNLVKSFYMALSDGNGDLANSYLVPEKRNVGNFQKDRIESFYSHMKQKLQINNIIPIDETTVKVNFNYTVNKNICNGLSTVKLRKVDLNTTYIEKIISNC